MPYKVKAAEPKAKGVLNKWIRRVLKDRNSDTTLFMNLVSSIPNRLHAVIYEGDWQLFRSVFRKMEAEE